MFIASLVVIILIIGLLLYGFSANPKVAEIGRLMFLAAIIAICLGSSGQMFVLLGGRH